ncbi:alpha/beta hydrolase [Robiginitalea aurantiaca]|uniref:Lysophospholipase n=1 Tax=Robiginitalea aurantiaca TaxID=3056915 RepID=A0ABT7WGU2_9FLAO|nr:alpha/beta hydrolase [Robiginitalea aurantiaca]MDM9632137.1 lysophospholipase [Robiginitalea aurantiaca]
MTEGKYEVQTFKEDWEGVPIHGFWSLVENPRASILLIHGFGEHSGRYLKEVAPFFNRHGFSVLGFDLIGHGKSGGKRGHCQGYQQLMGLTKKGYHKLRSRYPELPLLLYGHSMGGNLALNFVLRGFGKPEGVIASSPYLRLAFNPPAWKWKLGKLLSRIAPSATVPSGLDPAGISRDPEEVLKYKADPLIHDKVSPTFSFPVIEAGEWAIQNAHNLDVPTLILHGTADPIIDPHGSRDFHAGATSTHLELLEDGYHELHHDLERERYFEAMHIWLESHTFKV